MTLQASLRITPATEPTSSVSIAPDYTGTPSVLASLTVGGVTFYVDSLDALVRIQDEIERIATRYRMAADLIDDGARNITAPNIERAHAAYVAGIDQDLADERETTAARSTLFQLRALFESSQREFSTEEVQALFPNENANTVRTQVARLAREGAIERVERGLYRQKRTADCLADERAIPGHTYSPRGIECLPHCLRCSLDRRGNGAWDSQGCTAGRYASESHADCANNNDTLLSEMKRNGGVSDAVVAARASIEIDNTRCAGISESGTNCQLPPRHDGDCRWRSSQGAKS